jgi:hypothetical protein
VLALAQAKRASDDEEKTSCKRLDLCWPQWVHFSSQEHYRTSWNLMESHGRFWNMAESSGC